MSESMLSFVMNHLPDNWDYVAEYKNGYKQFEISANSDEYQVLKTYFYRKNITRILRIQNPFQYGRYMLRREMVKDDEVSFYNFKLF